MTKDIPPKSASKSLDRELFRAALDRGYFESPPEVSIAELAREYEVTEREIKQKLAHRMSVVLQEYRSPPDERPEDGLLQASAPRPL